MKPSCIVYKNKFSKRESFSKIENDCTHSNEL